MLINPLQQPVLPATNLAPQALSQALPQVQALAAAPLTQRAVTPTHEKERAHGDRSNKEKREGGDTPNEQDYPVVDEKRGHFINTSV